MRSLLFNFFILTYFFFYSICHARVDLNSEEIKVVNKVVTPTNNFSKAERSENLSGGAGTVAIVGRNAYSMHFNNLSFQQRQDFLIGNGLFRKLWISAPASTIASDGLGPLYNARACQSCHIKDGRGHLPTSERPLSLVIKTGKYKGLELIKNKTYGKQFQFFAIPGILNEVSGKITTSKVIRNISKNYSKSLSKVRFDILDYNYGKFENDNSLSLRISPFVYGTGLINAIEDSDILKKEDKYDNDQDGISGIARRIKVDKNKIRVGRFGVRASTHNLTNQSGVAFMHDMGISNPVGQNPDGDCTIEQTECSKFPNGNDSVNGFEASKEVLDKVVFYLSSLSPPKRRNVNDSDVLKGKEIFYKSQCTSCHTPKYVTSKNADIDFLRYQLIWPYTDLLLHDMGDELADKDLEGNITNKEWKTPPLWGIGLAKDANPRATFLHDGRANTIMEAVLWHSGEAKKSLDYLIEKYGNDLDKLEKFLKSL